MILNFVSLSMCAVYINALYLFGTSTICLGRWCMGRQVDRGVSVNHGSLKLSQNRCFSAIKYLKGCSKPLCRWIRTRFSAKSLNPIYTFTESITVEGPDLIWPNMRKDPAEGCGFPNILNHGKVKKFSLKIRTMMRNGNYLINV